MIISRQFCTLVEYANVYCVVWKAYLIRSSSDQICCGDTCLTCIDEICLIDYNENRFACAQRSRCSLMCCGCHDKVGIYLRVMQRIARPSPRLQMTKKFSSPDHKQCLRHMDLQDFLKRMSEIR